ncbi:MAG: cysteine desulfurase-like protein [Sphingomonas sp.]
MAFPIDHVRGSFPALSVAHGGNPRVYLDAPGGTQACAQSIAAMAAHLSGGTANSGGVFETSVATDALSAAAHAAIADLLGGAPDEIAFGPNMTSLTLAVSRSLARSWAAGDEIILTRLDHDANVAPWLMAAEDKGVTVRWIGFDADTGRLDMAAIPGLLNRRTRLVAVGAASNALGTINDIPAISSMVRAGSDALFYVDGVQSVPHLPTDVRALGCDFLVCSPYKFFGPHIGALWGKRAVLEHLTAYKVRPAATAPGAVRFETGTPSFEAQAGVAGMIAYLEGLDVAAGGDPAGTRRDRLVSAMEQCAAYEAGLGERLLAGLLALNSVRLYGPASMDGRVPTFAFTVASMSPQAVVERLAAQGIFAWSGHFYAVETVAALGLESAGGLIRVGLCHYNTACEVDRVLRALGAMLDDGG